jgi:hypothetical protein
MLAALLVVSLVTCAADAQILHLVPSLHSSRTPQSFLDACLHVDQWPAVYGRATYLGSHDGLDAAESATLSRCFAQMNARGLRLTLETGVTGAFASGQEAFNWNSPKWRRFVSLGAPLSVLFLDEPLHNGTVFQRLSYSTIVDETATWIALVRRNFPSLKLVLIEPFPVQSSTQIVAFVDDLNAAAASRGVAGLNGLEIDHAWDGSQRPWTGAEMADMRSAARKRGMDFAIIFYGAMPFADPTNDCDFRARLDQQWTAYQANGIDHYGFYPDIYSIETWDQLPSVTTPESTKACTFMQGAKQWIDSIHTIPAVRPGLYLKNLPPIKH